MPTFGARRFRHCDRRQTGAAAERGSRRKQIEQRTRGALEVRHRRCARKRSGRRGPQGPRRRCRHRAGRLLARRRELLLLALVEACVQSPVEFRETRQEGGIVGKRSFRKRFVHVRSFIPAIADRCIVVAERTCPETAHAVPPRTTMVSDCTARSVATIQPTEMAIVSYIRTYCSSLVKA